jgi:hypothetical protein
MRTLLAPLLATPGALLGILGACVGRNPFVVACSCLSTAWGWALLRHLIVGSILGSGAT